MIEIVNKSSREALLHPLFVTALAGDRSAYDDLLRQVASVSRGYVRRKLGDSADCEDIIQEILLSVHKALHSYDPSRPCMPWLAAIMHYRLSDWLRKYYRAGIFTRLPLEEIEALLYEEVTEPASANEYLDQAVQQLSKGQQAVIRSMFGEDLSVRETSAKLGMSISAVKVTAHRAYRKLRQRLEGE